MRQILALIASAPRLRISLLEVSLVCRMLNLKHITLETSDVFRLPDVCRTSDPSVDVSDGRI